MDLVIPPPPLATLLVAGSAARFPVRRVYCIGRNYAAHAREMGHDPEREAPFFFLKPADAAFVPGADVPWPRRSGDVQPEVELVVALGAGGSDVDPARALDLVFGYGVGIDLTRRDLQAEAKRHGRPWAAAKAFDHSAPCSPLSAASAIGHPRRGRIWLEVNGERRQEGDLGDMIWGVGEALAQLSTLFALAAGDLLLTGTPQGVGPVAPGDRLRAGIDGVGEFELGFAR
jgi:fumarylpyruvate hydrolase